MRFARLIIVAVIDYEIIFTTKISRLMVHVHQRVKVLSWGGEFNYGWGGGVGEREW